MLQNLFLSPFVRDSRIQMGKKRKHSEKEAPVDVKADESAPERPKRTLFGFKDKTEEAKKEDDTPHVGFRNKEKVLITCSRRISYRFNILPFLIGY